MKKITLLFPIFSLVLVFLITSLYERIHSVHPLAGQGFNLVLRDIEKFCQLLKNNLNLGLDINNSGILKEFNKSRKPENIILGLGIDFTNYFFKYSKLFDISIKK